MKKNWKMYVLSIVLVFILSGCGVDHAENTTGDSQTSDVIYEGAFLDNDEIADLFASVRGEEAPFANVTKDYHVTTEYMPEQTHRDWYGETINVHITAYAVQEVAMDDGQMTSNEGFKVDVTSENEELNEYLQSLGKNYHITGAYQDGAKYTEYIDFSKGEAVDVSVEGTFGGYCSDGMLDLGESQK